MEKIFPMRLRRSFCRFSGDREKIQEIRMRSNQPLNLCVGGEDWFLRGDGCLCKDKEQAIRVSVEDIQESMAYICQYSLYAHENEIRNGFITIQGGHRVGVAGQTVPENGKIKSIAHISSLNIRVAHQIKGCGKKLFFMLWEKGKPCHTLIVSPPGGGKTTLLRDVIRLFSDGFAEYPGMSVGLVDERSEVSACYMGVPQNDVGIRTDVMDNCPKHEGIRMMVRSMAPKMVAFDELGGEKDVEAVAYAMHSGCRVLATVHGQDLKDVHHRCGLMGFDRYVILGDNRQAGKIMNVLDKEGRALRRMAEGCCG